MSIQSEIDRLKDNVSAAYSAMETAGAEMPDEQTSANLAATALTLALTAEKIISALGYTPANSNLFPVTSSNIHNSAITRAKLANDALYSSVVWITSNRNLASTDLGGTLCAKWQSAASNWEVTLTQAISANFPIGCEIAFTKLFNANNFTLKTSGIRLIVKESSLKDISLAVAELGGMFALKKFETNNNAGDLWLVTGNVEVVE